MSFATLADVPSGNFDLYLQSFGQTSAVFTSPSYSLFAQDEYVFSSGLHLNYELRYDLQVPP
ncbi:MAG: hypothetical protein ACYDHE_05405 [Candidatus Acidiferrales bacterium]